MKAIRVATICHNDDNHTDRNHRRVRIELHKTEGGYTWMCDGDDTGVGSYNTVAEAEAVARAAWGADVWAMKSKW